MFVVELVEKFCCFDIATIQSNVILYFVLNEFAIRICSSDHALVDFHRMSFDVFHNALHFLDDVIDSSH